MKKALALLLALVMLAALTACSGSVGSSNLPASTGSGPDIKFDPPVTVTGVRAGVNTSWMADLPLDDNPWTDLYLERHGIKIAYDWTCDETQYEEKVNLAIMNGEIPDIMAVNAQQYQQLYEAGLLQSLDSAFYDYATPTTIEYTQEQGELAYEACKRDGELYAIPWVTLVKENANVLYVRKDWLDATGSPEATTFENFETILANFHEKKPGGVDYCIPESKTLSFFYSVVCPMFGAYPNIWVEKDGKLENGIIQPEMKDALAKYAEWYQAGYIDPEFITNDGAKVVEKIGAEQVGIYFGPFSSPLSGWSTAAQANENIEMSYTVIPTASGEPVKMPIDTGIYLYWVVSKDCKVPMAVTLMINDFMEKFYDATSEEDALNYINDANGMALWMHSYCRSYRGFKNYQQSIDVQKYLAGEMEYDDLTSDSKGVATRIQGYLDGDRSLWGWNEIYGPEGIFDAVEQLIENDSYIQTAYYGPPTEGMGMYNSALSDLALQVFTDIITGAKDISAFDEFVTQYLAQGGQQIQDEVNEWKASLSN